MSFTILEMGLLSGLRAGDKVVDLDWLGSCAAASASRAAKHVAAHMATFG
jgi:hypothetical protein